MFNSPADCSSILARQLSHVSAIQNKVVLRVEAMSVVKRAQICYGHVYSPGSLLLPVLPYFSAEHSMGCGHTFLLLGQHMAFYVLWNRCMYWGVTADSCWSSTSNNGGGNLKKVCAQHVTPVVINSWLDLKASRIYRLANWGLECLWSKWHWAS